MSIEWINPRHVLNDYSEYASLSQLSDSEVVKLRDEADARGLQSLVSACESALESRLETTSAVQIEADRSRIIDRHPETD